LFELFHVITTTDIYIYIYLCY